MTPMMPPKLIANPINTITMRPPTLEVIPRLSTLIAKPSSVITTPSKIISLQSSLFLAMFPGFALQEENSCPSQRCQTQQQGNNAYVRCQARCNEREANKKQNDTLWLRRIRSHPTPPDSRFNLM